MNNKVRISIIVVLFSIVSFTVKAQFSIELNTGYAAPLYYFGKNKVYEQEFAHNYTYLDTSFTEFKKYNMGNGIRFGVSLAYITKNRLKFGLSVNYLNNKDVPLLYNSYKVDEAMVYNWNYGQELPLYYAIDEQFVKYNSIITSLIPNLGYIFRFDNSSFEVNIGGTLTKISVFINHISRSEWVSTITNDGLIYDPNGQFFHLYERISKSKADKLLISPSIGFIYHYKIKSNFGLTCSATIFPFMSFDQDKSILYYTSTREVIVDKENFEEQTWNVVYNLPAGTTPERYNLNSLNLCIGLRYTFAKE